MFCNLNRAASVVVINELNYGEFLSGSRVNMRKRDALLIQFLIESGCLSDQSLRDAVHIGICNCGYRCFKTHIANPMLTRPDHTRSPQALGYAYLHGKVSQKEARLIMFDHGESLYEYRNNASGFLESVMEQIAQIATSPEPESFQPQMYDPCSCHD